MFAVSQQSARPDIVGQDGKQQSILAVVLEHHQTFHQVCSKQGVRLPFRHRRRELLSGQKLMIITHIGGYSFQVCKPSKCLIQNMPRSKGGNESRTFLSF